MALNLRANTAVDVLIGPFVDSGDGDTTEDGLTLSQADIKLSKNGQALAQKNDATAAAFDDDGYYNCELDATDTNTEGQLVLIVHESGALSVRHEFNILSEAAWDSLYAVKDDGFMDVNIKTIGRADTQETEANNLESACANYSVTRGLTGTAVPAAAADAAAGLPISDAGGLDLDNRMPAAGTITNLNTLYDGVEGFGPAYAGPRGPGVYLNDAAANTSTTNGVDGTWSNPVSTIAAAKTIADSLSVDRIYFVNDSSVTLADPMEDYEFVGIGEMSVNTVNFGSQDVDNSVFHNLLLTGAQGGTSRCQAEGCALSSITGMEITALGCLIADGGSLTLRNDCAFDSCFSAVAGASTPTLNINSVANVNVYFRHYSGGMKITNAVATTVMSYEADGQLVIDATCTSLTIVPRGNLSITDNGTTTNLNSDAAINLTNINAECDAALVDGTVTLADGAHGGSSAVLTLQQVVVLGANGAAGSVDIDNSDGPGIKVDGTTHGVHVTASAGVGIEVDGSTTGIDIDSTGGDGVAISGATIGVNIDGLGTAGVTIDGNTIGVDIDGAAGAGIQVSGTTHGLEVAASAGPGIEVDGTTFGVEIDASAGPGMHIGGTTIGLDIDASAGIGVDIDGTSSGMEITASVTGVKLTGETGLWLVGTADSAMLVDGTSRGLQISASAGPGVDIDGTTFGIDIDASAGPGVAIDGTSVGIDVNASAGSGIQVTGTTHGLEITASAGIGIEVDGSTAGIDIDSTGGDGIAVSGATIGINIDGLGTAGVTINGNTIGVDIDGQAGPGIQVSGTTFGIEIDASAGPGIHVDGTTFGIDVNASAGSGVRIVGTANDILADITGSITGGTVNANLTQIEGHALAGTGTRIADGFEYWFDVATPAKTMNDAGVAGSGLTAQQVWEYASARTVTVSDKAGFKLASDGVDLIVIETGTNLRQAMSIMGANIAGKISGAEGTTVICTGIGVDTVRTTTTTTVDGNRTAVALARPA